MATLKKIFLIAFKCTRISCDFHGLSESDELNIGELIPNPNVNIYDLDCLIGERSQYDPLNDDRTLQEHHSSHTGSYHGSSYNSDQVDIRPRTDPSGFSYGTAQSHHSFHPREKLYEEVRSSDMQVPYIDASGLPQWHYPFQRQIYEHEQFQLNLIQHAYVKPSGFLPSQHQHPSQGLPHVPEQFGPSDMNLPHYHNLSPGFSCAPLLGDHYSHRQSNYPQQFEPADLPAQVFSGETSQMRADENLLHSLVPSNHQQVSAEISNGSWEIFNPLVTNMPLVTFYIMAYSLHPFKVVPYEAKYDLLKKIGQAIKTSPFDYDMRIYDVGIPPELRIERSLALQGNKFVPRPYCFLARLCLKNIAFLLAIHENFDESISKETGQMLSWLHNTLKDPSSPVKILVDKHLSMDCTAPETYLEIYGRTKKVCKKVGDLSAKEAPVIVTVLGSYYKSQNLNKWKTLFKKDVYFLEYFLQLGLKDLEGTKTNIIDRHWRRFKGVDLLPWGDGLDDNLKKHIQSLIDSSLHKTKVHTLFTFPTEIPTLIKSRMTFAGQIKGLKELQKYINDNKLYN